MENIFITGIQIEKYRNIEKLDIKLSQDTRKHLIITGKNGSGKTSLLNLMVNNFDNYFNYPINALRTTTALRNINEFSEMVESDVIGAVNFNNEAYTKNVLMFSLPAEHLFRAANSSEISNIKYRYTNKTIYRPKESVYQNILQTMVIMRIQQLEAKESNDEPLFIQSEKWFSVLKNVLSSIYENQTLELKYIPHEFDYKIILNGYEFNLNQMADGFSAFFRIVSEIMEKMDHYNDYKCDYTLPGIAFIDELETHMHITMQKMALGFLTEMFPNVQFIVTTHSPFIITSLENSVVYDLSKRESLENPYQYSYESIIEGYYDIDMYSKRMKKTLDRYKELAYIERSGEENKEFSRLRIELQTVAPAQKEIYLAFKDIEGKRKLMGNG